ncbi:MAG TPA: hypothetical protein VGO62_10620 [Myxococcota bacterium]|jgi:hypothetical protein
MLAPRVCLVIGSLSLAASLWPTAACSSTDSAKKTDAQNASAAEASVGATRLADDGFDPSCCTKREFDLNKDGKPDSYQFVKVIDNEPVIVRKESDVNFDGRIDLIRTLSDKGELLQERLDTDFDGRIDVVIFFEKGQIIRKEYDTNFDNKVDEWVYFDKGVMTRKEADLNYDGKVDYWEYFEGGKLDRVGVDRDYDGNVDEWTQAGPENGG